MTVLQVGTRVKFKFGDVLWRDGQYSRHDNKRTWRRQRERRRRLSWGVESDTEFGNPETDDIVYEGFLVGIRTLKDGTFYPGHPGSAWSEYPYEDAEPSEFTVSEHFKAYLIVSTLHSAPVKVKAEDVEVVS